MLTKYIYKEDLMKSGLSTKLLVPILILIFLSVTTTTVFAYYQQYRIINRLMKSVGETALEEISTQINNSENMIEILTQSLKNNYLRITRTLAKVIEADPSLIETNKMIDLANFMKVDEIHITDEKGVLSWGNIPGFYGFDFNETDQTRPFIPMLKDKTFELAQDPTERGIDKTLFQYISVPRIDKTGIIQIGTRPMELEQLVKSSEINTVIKDIKVGQNGFGFITDLKGTIIAHINDELLGENISIFGIPQSSLNSEIGNFNITIDNESYNTFYKKTADKIIFANVLAEEYTGSLKSLLFTMSIFVLIILTIAILLVYGLTKKVILKPVHLVCSRLEEIAFGEGDLTQQVDINTNDEFQELACNFNEFVNKLRKIIIEVFKGSEELDNNVKSSNVYIQELAQISAVLNNETQVASAGAEEISANTNTIAESVEHSSKNIENIKNTSNDMANLMNKVVSETNNVSKNVQEVGQFVKQLETNSVVTQDNINNVVNMINQAAIAIEEISSSIQEIAAKTKQANSISEHANKQAMETSDIINELNISATEIGKIIKVINAIADQTNMLALNATIEAASAGEAGKGFAVVANEVKELAKQTAEATEKISSQIDSVQNASAKSSTAITTISKIIKELFEINNNITISVEDQSKTINDINTSIRDIADNSNQIKNIAKDNTEFSKRATKNANQANESVIKISQDITDSASISKNIASELTDINSGVKDITRNTSEISIGIAEISETILNISNSSDDTAKKAKQSSISSENMISIIKGLKNSLSKFKV